MSEESVITNRAVFAMAFPDVRRMMLLRRAIPMRRKTAGDRLRSVRQQRGGRFPGMKRSRRRRRKQHGRGLSLPRGFSLPSRPYVTLRR